MNCERKSVPCVWLFSEASLARRQNREQQLAGTTQLAPVTAQVGARSALSLLGNANTLVHAARATIETVAKLKCIVRVLVCALRRGVLGVDILSLHTVYGLYVVKMTGSR